MKPLLLLAVASGGAIGSVARYLTSSYVGHLVGATFPWGTLVVNIAGSFVIGGLTGMMAFRWNVSPELRLLLITGFLGGYTTFSAFSLEMALMVERGTWSPAIGYALASVLGCVVATLFGLWVARGVG